MINIIQSLLFLAFISIILYTLWHMYLLHKEDIKRDKEYEIRKQELEANYILEQEKYNEEMKWYNLEGKKCEIPPPKPPSPPLRIIRE